MKIFVNGYEFDTKSKDNIGLKEEISNLKSGKIYDNLTKMDINSFDICIANGFAINGVVNLEQGMNIAFIKRGSMPSLEVLKSMIEARNSPELNSALNSACIGIAGLGGLGSNIALSLARAGVKKLILVDFDIVEPSNLNRQQYFVRHIGMKKIDAMKELIKDVNPFVEVQTHDLYLDASNVASTFMPCAIVCEAFDNIKSKTMILNEAGNSLNDKKIVAASGMAGYHSSNDIKTMKFAKNVYICGDLKNEAKIGQGLMAPRVAICANHEANLVLRLILGLEI